MHIDLSPTLAVPSAAGSRQQIHRAAHPALLAVARGRQRGVLPGDGEAGGCGGHRGRGRGVPSPRGARNPTPSPARPPILGRLHTASYHLTNPFPALPSKALCVLLRNYKSYEFSAEDQALLVGAVDVAKNKVPPHRCQPLPSPFPLPFPFDFMSAQPSPVILPNPNPNPNRLPALPPYRLAVPQGRRVRRGHARNAGGHGRDEPQGAVNGWAGRLEAA